MEKKVVLDDVQYFHLGANKFALSVWKKKENVEADPAGKYRGKAGGDPHLFTYWQRFNTSFSKGEYVAGLVPLDTWNNPKSRPRWMYMRSHTAYENETRSSIQGKIKSFEDTYTSVTFFGVSDDGHYFGFGEYVDVTNADEVGG